MFHQFGFAAPVNVQGRASIADLFKPDARCGIYILHFSNGEYYAGKAVDVTRRYIQHQKNHKDIIEISFKHVAPEKLDSDEQEIIWTLEQKGYSLRNVVFTSLPKGESDFDLIMPLESQQSWLRDMNIVRENDGDRITDPGLRRKFRAHYERLFNTQYADQVIKAVKVYICFCIPVPHQSEVSFWSVSCMPEQGVYLRINLYWQEVLTVFNKNGDLWVSLHVAKSPLSQEKLSPLTKSYQDLQILEHQYKPGGTDQLNLLVPLKSCKAVITDRCVLPAIRLFNLRLMKKGPCNFGRYHCLDLADRLFESECRLQKNLFKTSWELVLRVLKAKR